ncbi:ABC transporter substrate-binding protein [Virgisporangium ochraceum]|uniref:ABC transporter substrate-binding protein n=1 Tax=Virgisporangium ochraceum TaxID=65505 RepID=A0A8J4EKC5_9ACTN|nr:extracellular solute-binding protein [Virgisporangium ochraceum]GIJ75237.1 ABC transporter substrate-binding protein [Virgisporangium ochraceum]
MVRRFATAVWEWARRHRFRSGVLTGVVVGALVAVLVPALLPDRPDGLEPPTDDPLIILSGLDESDDKQREILVAQWNATHRQQARIVSLPARADDAHAAMVEYAQATANRVDIYNLDVTWTAEFAAARYIVPFPGGPVDRSGFLEKPLLTCEWNGKLWALPFNTDAALLYHRTDLGLEPPGSLTGVRAAIDQVRQRPVAERRGVEAGYVSQLRAYEGLTVNALEAIWAAGGDVVSRDNRIVIKSEEAAAGLRWLAAGLAEPGNLPLILPGSRGFDERGSTDAFAEGRAAFMRNWPVAYRLLTPEGAPAPRVPFAVTPLPGGPSVLGGQNLAVSSRSARPRAARALIEYLTSERSQQILFERGGLAATRRIVYLDARVQERYPYAQTLLESIEAARPRPMTTNYVAFSQVFQGVVREALDDNGRITDDHVQRLEAALRGRR